MEEEFVVLGSLRILALLIAYVETHVARLINSTDPKPIPENHISTLLASLQGLLNGTRQPLWEVAAQVLGAVLGSKQFRTAVWKEEHCISG
jgi:V-type H+-transporting ATPase subunit H